MNTTPAASRPHLQIPSISNRQRDGCRLGLWTTLLLTAASLASAQTTWTKTGAGDFSNSSNWSSGTPTGSTDTTINNGTSAQPSTVNLNGGSASVGNLTIGNFDALNINLNSVFTLSGSSLANSGTLNVNAGSGTNSFLQFAHDTSLTGGGKIVLNSGDNNGTAYFSQAVGGITVTNVDNTIQGYGIIGAGGLTLKNQGTISANVSAQTLVLNNGGGITNSGLLTATNGGTLRVQTNVDNTGGNVTANGGSIAIESGTTVTGGSLNTQNGGTLGVSQNHTVSLDGKSSGAINLHSDVGGTTWTGNLNTVTNVVGTFNNNGTIQLNAGSGTNTYLQLSGNTTLQGGGKVTLNSGDLNGQAFIQQSVGGVTLTNVDHVVQGYGTIGNGGLAVDNKATITANVTGKTLLLNGGGNVNNEGVLVATNGGNLHILNTVSNVGHSINANGGTVAIDGNATILGGTLNSLNGGSIAVAANNSANLDGSHPGGLTLHTDSPGGTTWTGNLNTITNVQGSLQNNGNIQLNAGQGNNTYLQLQADTTLQGGGTVTLNSGDNNGKAVIQQGSGGLTLTNADHVIQGYGTIGNGGLAVDNKSIITANVSGQTLLLNGSGNVNNEGSLIATNGGNLHIVNTISNAGHAINADNGTVAIDSGAVILGGSLNSLHGGSIALAANNSATLDGQSNGPLTLHSDAGGTTWTGGLNSTTNVRGTINNDGNIQLNAGHGTNSYLQLLANTTLQGGGTVTLNSSDSNGKAVIQQGSGGLTLTNADHVIQGYGTIGNGGLAVDNKSIITANVSGQTLLLNGSGNVNNEGSLIATNGGNLHIVNTISNAGHAINADNGTVAIDSGAVILGGSLNSLHGGSIGLAANNSATLDGQSTGPLTLHSDIGGTTWIGNLNSTTNVQGTLNNDGNIQLNAGGGANTYLQLAASTTLQGGGTVSLNSGDNNGRAIIQQSAGGLTLTNADHTIHGYGTIGNGGLTVVNGAAGTLLADSAGNTLVVNGSGGLTNNGTLQANADSTLQVGSTLSNFSGNTLTGGTYIVNGSPTATGTLQLNLGTNLGGEIVNNAATIALNGPTAHTKFVDSNGNDALAHLAANSTASSSLTLTGGNVFTTSGAFSNAGTIHAGNGGTFVASQGVSGPTGTIQIDSGGTVSLAGGSAPSTVGTLTQNGALALGSNSVTVSSAYNNANFGSGNSFNNHADVTGSGQILAAGDTKLAISGSAVTGGSGTTPTLAGFGSVHVGESKTLTYSISNSGTTGPQVLGAIQTSVSGGHITDSRLSGSGVTAGNFGPLNNGQSTGPYTVTFTATSAGALAAGQTVHFATNFDNVASPTLTLGGGAAYQLASTGSLPSAVNLGNVHVGAALGTNLTVTNTAPDTHGYTETLAAAVTGTSGAVNTSGAVAGLAQGTSSNAIGVSLDTSTAGALHGSATVAFTSEALSGSGLSNTSLGSQTVNVSGAAYNLASAKLGTIDFGKVLVGSSVSQVLNVFNVAPTGAFSEGLDATLGSFSGLGASLLHGSGAITNLAAGSSDNHSLNITLDTSSAGAIGAHVQVNLASNGATTSGLGITGLPSQLAAINGEVDAIAEVGSLASAGAITPNPVNLGNARVGAAVPTQSLSVTNTAVGPAEGLNASFGGSTAGVTVAGSVSSLSAGATDHSSLQVGLNTATAGNKSGNLMINLASDGSYNSGVTTSLGSQSIAVTGAVYQTAQANTLPTEINLGTVRLGTVLGQSLTVQNLAPTTGGYTETLGAHIQSLDAGLGGSGALTGLAAGGPSGTLDVSFTAAHSGSYHGSAVVGLQSEEINSSGLGNLMLAPQTVTFDATVNRLASIAVQNRSSYSLVLNDASTETLDFGTVFQGSSPTNAQLRILNPGVGPADSLVGMFDPTTLSGSPFSYFGGHSFNISSDGSFDLFFGFDTSALGDFGSSLTFELFSHNSDQADLDLGRYTLNFRGDVIAEDVGPGSPVPEPATYSAIGALALLAAAGYRRVRVKRSARF